MPAPVLVVHDDAHTRDLSGAALNAAGLVAVGFLQPMAALAAIETDSCRCRSILAFWSIRSVGY
jgi:DNA-binding NtrC family response regulator